MDKTQPNLFYLQRTAMLGLLLALAAAAWAVLVWAHADATLDTPRCHNEVYRLATL